MRAEDAIKAFLAALNPAQTAAKLALDVILQEKEAAQELKQAPDEQQRAPNKYTGGRIPKAVPHPAILPLTQVLEAATEASNATGVPQSYFRLLIALENFVDATSVRTSYEGTFRGVAQFNAVTWNGVLREQGLEGPPWAEGVRDPYVSLRMAGFLYQSNRRVFRNQFGPRTFTDELAYLYHQQGASAARQYLASGNIVYDKQSPKSIDVLGKAKAQFAGLAPRREPDLPNWV